MIQLQGTVCSETLQCNQQKEQTIIMCISFIYLLVLVAKSKTMKRDIQWSYYLHGIYIKEATNSVVEGNVIKNMHSTGNSCTGILTQVAQSTNITNNQIHCNGAYADFERGIAFMDYGAPSAVVTNTVFGNKITKCRYGIAYANNVYDLNANFNLLFDTMYAVSMQHTPVVAQIINVLNNDFRGSKLWDIDVPQDNVVNAGFNYWSGVEPETQGHNVDFDWALNASICSTRYTQACCGEGLFDQEESCIESCSASIGFYTFLQDRVCLSLYGCSNMLWYVSGEDCIETCLEDKPFFVFGISECLNKDMCNELGRFGYNGTQCVTDCLGTNHKYYYDGVCYEGICPTSTYGVGDSGGECVSDSEGPEGLYADEITHLFIDAAICNQRTNNMSLYTSLDESSKRCVIDCQKTDKTFIHNGECVSICPQYYYGQESDNSCTKECPAGYYEYGEDGTCKIDCKDSSCKTCDYTTDLCTSCGEGKILYEGTCLIKCPLPLLNLDSTCVEECGTLSVEPYTQLVLYGTTCLLSCPGNTVLFQNECLNICPEGYYQYPNRECFNKCLDGQQALEQQRMCITCDSTCLTCYGTNSNQCTSCPKGQSLQDNRTCTEDQSSLSFKVQRVYGAKYEFQVIFSKDLTDLSAATVLKTIVLNIDGMNNTNNQSYLYSLQRQITMKIITQHCLILHINSTIKSFLLVSKITTKFWIDGKQSSVQRNKQLNFMTIQFQILLKKN